MSAPFVLPLDRVRSSSAATSSLKFTLSNREINRELDWRLQRLEATQMPAQSIDRAFQQVDDELDELQDNE